MNLPVWILGILICCLGGKVQSVKSTSQEWVGGLRESGYGTDYKVTVKVKAGSDELVFGDLWVDSVRMKVRLSDPASQQVKSFKKGTTLILSAGLTYRPGPDDRVALAGAERNPPPVNFKGKGLLAYTYKGRQLYMEITGFEKLEKIIYP